MNAEHRAAVVAPVTFLAGRIETVTRWATGTIVLGGPASEVRATLETLRGPGDAEPGAGVLIERLRMVRTVDLAAAVGTPAGLRLFSLGLGQTSAVTEARESPVEPDEPQRGAVDESEIDVTTPMVWIGLGPPPDAARKAEADDRIFDLAAGTVPGRGVVLSLPDHEVIPPLSIAPFEVADLQLPNDPRRAPLPIAVTTVDRVSAIPASDQSGPSTTTDGDEPSSGLREYEAGRRQDEVHGIQCSRNHFNNPRAAYCQVCGISMLHLTHRLVTGARPTLGFLVFDDGATFALDRQYVIGREPPSDLETDLAPLTADDAEHTVSREHAELTFDGWDVNVADLGSTNGTFIWRPEQREWERVLPNRPTVLPPGSSVAVGRKTFVYEPVARSV